jgi:hypothetical protein
MSVREVLEKHEIAAIHYNPVPDNGNPRTSGYWIAVAHCTCGYTSPPEHRAHHLTMMLGEL